MDGSNEFLVAAAKRVVGAIELRDGCVAGEVGAALRAADGHIYTGICLHMCCGIGFCAEHSAIAEMLKARVTKIDAIVAVDASGEILSPCGRCRELMIQVDDQNAETKVVLPGNRVVSLQALLPEHWLTKGAA